MLRTRLWMGSLLASVMGAVLIGDGWLAPWFPCLFVFFVGAAFPAVREFLSLQRPEDRTRHSLSLGCVILVLASNWYSTCAQEWPTVLPSVSESWSPLIFTLTCSLLLGFAVEILSFRKPGASSARVANLMMTVLYLGLLPSFLVKLRRLNLQTGGVWLTLAIFVPKCCDIAAYFVGRLFGRTPFSPWLSPKKTWEGVVGGVLGGSGAALVVWYGNLLFRGPEFVVFRHGWMEAVLFGIVIGFVGVIGDLAESLLKRDGSAKDASASVPGFGGVLDVLDSVIFAAPVAYLWFVR